MIELNAKLFCDRCDKVIVEMNDVVDIEDAHQRLRETEWGGEDEDGNEVCSACWAKVEDHSACDAVGKPFGAHLTVNAREGIFVVF